MPNRKASVVAFALLFCLNCRSESPTGNTRIKDGILGIKAEISNAQEQLVGTVNFGEVEMGTRVTTRLTISNVSSDAIINLESVVATQSRDAVISPSVTASVGPELTGDAGGAFRVDPPVGAQQIDGIIPRNASVFAELSFSPTGSELTHYLGALVVTTTTGQSARLSLGGTGTAGAATRIIGLSGDMAFGDVEVNTEATTTLTISNSGNSTLAWTGLSTGDATVTASQSGGTVVAGASENVTLTFTPTAATSLNSTLTVTNNATSGTNTIALSGTGIALGTPTRIISLSGNMDFGVVEVNTEATTTLTISNSGNSTLAWTGLSTGDATVTASATSGTVVAGASENVTLTFTPTAATSLNSTLTVTNNATSGTNTIALTAEVLSAATRIIGLSGDFDFGDVAVGASATSTLTITNTGDSTLTWVAPQEDSDGVFTTEPHSGTVDPGGGTGTTTVTFSPRDVRSYSRSQRMTGNKTSGTDTYTLTGTGTAGAATRIIGLSGPGDAATVAFGNVAELTSINRTLTIANTGNSTLTLTRIDIGDSHYSASPTSGTVAAGAQLTVTVTFVPSERKEHPATLAVTSDKTSGNEMIAVTGMGCDALAEGCVSGT